MKRLLIALLLLLAAPAWAEEPVQLARMNAAMLGSAAACTPSYGSEERTSNTADKPSDTDADAVIDTTGWQSQGLAQLVPVDTADSVCGDGDDDCPDPQRGTFAIFMRADSDGDRGYHDLSGYGLDASQVYKLSYYARHSGVDSTATWGCIIHSANSGPSSVGSYRQLFTTTENTYSNYTTYFLYNARQSYFNCGEHGASNDGGLYVDNFSITPATLCYGDEKTTGHAGALTGEADATTGWTGSNNGIVASVDDGDSVCGTLGDQDCSAPNNGTFSLFILSDQTTQGSGAYFDLNTILTDGTKYFVRFFAKADGTNYFSFGLGSSTTNLSVSTVSYNGNAWVEFGFSFVHSATATRYLSFLEGNSGNDGSCYVDGLSIREITSE